MDQTIKNIKQKGTTLLEALVATAIIGIGFIAIFQMVTYSVRSIDVSGERTKINYLTDMIVEDLMAYKSSEKASVKLYDALIVKMTKVDNEFPENIGKFIAILTPNLQSSFRDSFNCSLLSPLAE